MLVAFPSMCGTKTNAPYNKASGLEHSGLFAFYGIYWPGDHDKVVKKTEKKF